MPLLLNNLLHMSHEDLSRTKVKFDELGFDYVAQNFQYSILENYNARVNKDIILEREAWWKKTLGSRAFGLNAN